MSAFSFTRPRNDDTAQRLLWKVANLLGTGLGIAGAQRVADTATYTGTYAVFHAITDCVISAITYEGSGGAAAGDTIKAGDRIYGTITSFKLTSGTGELYNVASS